MILGRADHEEQLGAVEVGPAEFPERAADGVDHPGGHVHRAKAAVGRVIGRAELAREQAGERLHLVAPGEQRELFRIGRAQMREPLFERREGFVPTDFDELAGTALGARLALERFGQPCRGVLLHDPRRALGADDPLVKRMIRIAFDVTHLAVTQVHADAAPACAHVARGGLDLGLGVRQWRRDRVVQRMVGHARRSLCAPAVRTPGGAVVSSAH